MPDAPIIIPPGEGKAYWLVGDYPVFKLTAEQTNGKFDLAETTSPPGAGPPPHRHSREDEMFYILQGEFGLIYGDQSLAAKPGDAFYLPKNIPHTYKNIGTTPARFLVLAVPSGFAEFVKACGEPATDPKRPPPVTEAAIGKLLATVPKFGIEMLMDHRPTHQGPPFPAPTEYWLLGQRVALHLDGTQSAGNFCILTRTLFPSGEIPLHVHHRDAEMFYVLDGAVVFTLDELQITAVTGTFLYVPPGVAHALRNPGLAPAKVLDIHTPAGFEGFIRAAGTLYTNADATPPPPIDPRELPALVAKFGMELK